MKKSIGLIAVFLLSILFSIPAQKRVVCIGNSITEGWQVTLSFTKE